VQVRKKEGKPAKKKRNVKKTKTSELRRPLSKIV
jgi:hypothetical protein